MPVGQLDAVVHYLHEVARKGASEGLSDQDLLRRFLRQQDASSFDILVRRHGPLVLGVCRRVLRHDQDAEDAFQATFLVLVRKAASLRSSGTLANWLFGVASRTALEMRRAAARRRVKEALAMPRAESVVSAPPDFRAAFDEELALLPDRYREAVILCDLQGKVRREAALELGCAEGTVASRLARGRALLAQRLTRRGISISAGVVATAVMGESALAQVPLSLAASTTKAASLLATGHTLAGIASASIVAATEASLKSMFLLKLKTLAMLLVCLAVGLGATGLLCLNAMAWPGNAPANIQANETEAEPPTFVTGRVVDATGAPVANVSIEVRGPTRSAKAIKSDAAGNFQINLSDWPQFMPLVADDAKGRLGFHSREMEPKSGFTIRLLPAKHVQVRVEDGRGRPLQGSRVFLLLSNLLTTFDGVTASNGTISIPYPHEAEVGQVIAWKAGAGFDYASTLVAKLGRERKPLPKELTLRLTGSRTVQVKAVDSSDRPVTGLAIYPWTIEKPGMMENVNLSGCGILQVKTDVNGTAVFDCLPAEFAEGISFLSSSLVNSSVDIPFIRPGQAVDHLTMRVLRNARVSGKVSLPDGRSARNINIAASGAGSAMHNFNGGTKTAADGSYELLVHGEEAYIIRVVDKRWAAPSRIGVVVREGEPVENVDFALVEGTILRGTVTVGAANRPSPDDMIVLQENGGEIPPEIRKPGETTFHAVGYHDTQMTDARGEYRFCVGPGTYHLCLRSEGEPKIIVVKDQREIRKDFHRARSEWGALSGKVVDQKGRPIAGAKVESVYMRNLGYVDPEPVVSGPDGVFKFQRVLQVSTALFARTADNKLAGILRIDADRGEVTIRVGPTARAAGRLLTPDGAVAAGGKVTCGIQIPLDDRRNGPTRSCFGGSALADATGHFVIEGLVPGEHYDFNQGHDQRSGRMLHLTTDVALKAETIELGDVRPAEIEYLKTMEEKTDEYFQPRGRLAERIARAQVEAKRRNLRVLIVVGDPTDSKTQRFYGLAQGLSDPKLLTSALSAYESVTVVVRDKESMDLLRKEYGMGSQAINVPALAVLGPDGKVLAARDSWLDPRNPELSAEALKAFLTMHALPAAGREKGTGRVEATDRP